MKRSRIYFRLALIMVICTAGFSAALPAYAVPAAGEENIEISGSWIGGKIIWPDHDLTKASVEVFKDPKFKDLYTRGLILRPEGTYALSIEDPGTYYIVAFVDDNGNNQFDAGDGMGIFGVKNWADPNQKPKPIMLGAGVKLTGIDVEITAMVAANGKMESISPIEYDEFTGISGKLIWPEHTFPNTILFVYSNPSWNNRIAQTKVQETGEYKISLPAGRYYLLAVIDENNTNLLDVGDKFGIWGLTRFGMFPRAVVVEAGKIAENRNILIVGEIAISGKPRPLKLAADAIPSVEAAENLANRIPLSGNVIWPDHDVNNGLVQAYSDPSMAAAAAQAKVNDKGSFQLLLYPGEYYIVAEVDADGDGRYTAGDGIGAYGSANAASQMPEKLIVSKELEIKEINIFVTAEFDKTGQLKAISDQPVQMPADVAAEPVPDDMTEDVLPEDGTVSETGMSGKIVWEGRKISSATLVFSKDPDFETGVRTPLLLDEDGAYTCLTPPGDYYIMAVIEADDADEPDLGDGIGFYGAAYGGLPQMIAVLDGRMTPFVNITVAAQASSDGTILPLQTPGVIRSRYGEPESIYMDRVADSVTEEWWYWSKGVSFTFEKTGNSGWELTDTYEFTPRESETTKKVSASPGGTLYYAFDGSIWGMDTDGANRRWIAPGTSPTATADGKGILFLETGGDMYLIQPQESDSAKLVQSKRMGGLEPAISNQGKIAAFVRETDGLRSVVLQNLETGEENAIPSGEMNLYDPAWSPDDELIAYSAAPIPDEPDQQSPNRDIYYYSLLDGEIEHVSTSPLDEFSPAWSPGEERVLVYCRAEEDHAQLWIVNFDDEGKPVERQLTKYGGRNPTWSPQGDRIIYESNAQLWTISPDGSEEAPLTVDDEPVFGIDPFWTR